MTVSLIGGLPPENPRNFTVDGVFLFKGIFIKNLLINKGKLE